MMKAKRMGLQRATDVSKNFRGARFVTKDKKFIKFGSMGNGNMAEDDSSWRGNNFSPGRLSANAPFRLSTMAKKIRKRR